MDTVCHSSHCLWSSYPEAIKSLYFGAFPFYRLGENDFKFSVLISDVDAVGKPRSGYLRGNMLWLGSYSECRDISHAQYCTAKLGISVKNIKIPVCYFAYFLHKFFMNKTLLDL